MKSHSWYVRSMDGWIYPPSKIDQIMQPPKSEKKKKNQRNIFSWSFPFAAIRDRDFPTWACSWRAELSEYLIVNDRGGEEWNKDVRWNSHRYDRFKNFLTRCSVVKLLRLRGTNSLPEPGSPQAVGHAPATHLWTGRIHQPSLLSQITSDRDVGDMEQSNVEWGRRAAHNARWQIPWLARPCESRLTPCGHGGPTHARQRSPRRWWGGPDKSTCGQSG